MPHFTLEYSANLDSRVDMAKVVEIVRKAAVETGIFPVGGIRVFLRNVIAYASRSAKAPGWSA